MRRTDARRFARLLIATGAAVLVATAAACGGDATVASNPTDGSAPPTTASAGASRTAPAPTTGLSTTGSTPPDNAKGATATGTAPPPATATVVPSTTTTTANAPPPAPLAVTTTQLAIVDESRPTVSRGTTVSSSRSLPTTVYVPAGAGPYPLVVFAHGFEIGPGPYASFASTIAAAGYVVAAPSFPLTDRAAAGARLDRGDLPNQASDVAFVVAFVRSASTGTSGPLAGKVRIEGFGVVGHSDGADTALDTAYYPGRAIGGVQAVVALAPDAMTGTNSFVGSSVPLLLEHGTRDTIVPYSNSETVWRQVPAHRIFLTLAGADHIGPVQGAAPWAPVLERVVVDFLDRYVAGRTSSDDAILAHADVAGVASVQSAG